MTTVSSLQAANLKKSADTLLHTAVANGKIPGVAAAATTSTESFYQGGFGVRAQGLAPAMDLDTVMWIASMTKPLVGTAAMQLVEQGKLNLNKLPTETKKYLVSFHAYNQAIKNRFNDPILSKYPDTEYILKIDHEQFSSYLSQNPDIASVSPKVLEHMNGFNIYTSPSKKFILVPTTIFINYFSLNEISFKTKTELASNKMNRSLQCFDYRAQYNESFISIAEKYAVRIKDLRDSNPSVRFLRPGVNLSICST